MGCGASATVGKSPEEAQNNHPAAPVAERQRRIREGQEWPSLDNNVAHDITENVANQSNVQRVNENLNNNPNFFYNEDFLVQQAMQESLGNNPQQPQNEDELFNELLKDTLVMSRKEYDDIERKAKEEEIIKIKDNPELLKKKMENILSNKKLDPKNKKLPPLEMISKNMNKNKQPKQKKDLESIKAPILKQQVTESALPIDNRGTGREGNETESEIDIKESHKYDKQEIPPSYNPKLLSNEKHDQNALDHHNQFMSLESQEFGGNESLPNFARPNNQETNNDDEYQNLINYLNEDDNNERNRNKNSAQVSTLDLNNRSNYGKQKVNTKDSFDDLIDDLNINDKKPQNFQNNGLPGMAEVQIGNSEYKNNPQKNNEFDNLDDFEF